MKKKRNQVTKTGRFLLSLALIFCISAVWGCGPAVTEGQDVEKDGQAQEEGPEGEAAKGRFVESELPLPEDFYNRLLVLGKLADGRIVMVDEQLQRYASGDNGASWEKLDAGWMEQDGIEKAWEQSYISDYVMAPDGSFAFLYMKDFGEDDYRYVGGYADAEGNFQELTLDNDGLDGVVYQFCGIAPDGRVLGMSSGAVYAIDPAGGRAESLFQIGGSLAGAGYVFGDKLALTAQDQVYLYDFTAQELLDTDEALQKLVSETLNGQVGLSDSLPLVLAQGEGPEELYLAYREGVFRHTVGTDQWEQVILGGLTSFGDPQAGLTGLVRTADGGFLAAFANGMLCRYTYDETISAVPEKQMTVYSLKDDYTMRQAISLYQKEHPDTYIRFETGISGQDSGVTAEDAIKKLNTRLLAGDGPDMLLLDGLPADSYQEKGVLQDLSGILSSLQGENALFPNLVEAYRMQDGKLYCLPARFRLPLLAGKQDRIRQITDLQSLADAVESIRQEQPEGPIINSRSAEETLELLALTSSGAWTKEDGGIDEAAVTEFLTQAKRIHRAEFAGIPAEQLANYEEMQQVVSTDVAGEGHYNLETNNNLWPLCESRPEVLAAGMVKDTLWSFPVVTSVIWRHPEYDFTAYQGQVKNGFVPKALTAVCAGSGQKELAEDFFRFLFSREAQIVETVGGYPVNEAALTDMLQESMAEDDHRAGSGIDAEGSGPAEAGAQEAAVPEGGQEAEEADGEAPEEEKEAPAGSTEAPEEEKEAPADRTEAPEEEKEAPADRTEAPEEEKEAPAGSTEAPGDTEEKETPPRLGGMGSSDEEGNMVMLTVYAPTQEQADQFMELVRSADTPCSGNALVEGLVCRIGADVLKDEIKVEEGVAEIVKQAALYLAE